MELTKFWDGNWGRWLRHHPKIFLPPSWVVTATFKVSQNFSMCMWTFMWLSIDCFLLISIVFWCLCGFVENIKRIKQIKQINHLAANFADIHIFFVSVGTLSGDRSLVDSNCSLLEATNMFVLVDSFCKTCGYIKCSSCPFKWSLSSCIIPTSRIIARCRLCSMCRPPDTIDQFLLMVWSLRLAVPWHCKSQASCFRASNYKIISLLKQDQPASG